MAEYKNLKITPKIYDRLNKLRKGHTYSEILDEILTYFELTGINPKTDRTPPVDLFIKELDRHSSGMMKRLEAVVKIIRNIENTKIDPILHNIADSGNISSPTAYEEELTISDQEMFQLVQINKNLKEELQNKEKEMDAIQKKIDWNSSNKEDIIKIVENFFSTENVPRDRMGNITINEMFVKNLLNKIKNV